MQLVFINWEKVYNIPKGTKMASQMNKEEKKASQMNISILYNAYITAKYHVWLSENYEWGDLKVPN